MDNRASEATLLERLAEDGVEQLWVVFHDYSGRACAKIVPRHGFPAALDGSVSFAAHAGTPGLDGLGPIGGLDHGPDEYILRSSIVPRTALLAKLLMAIEAEQGRGSGDG